MEKDKAAKEERKNGWRGRCCNLKTRNQERPY